MASWGKSNERTPNGDDRRRSMTAEEAKNEFKRQDIGVGEVVLPTAVEVPPSNDKELAADKPDGTLHIVEK